MFIARTEHHWWQIDDGSYNNFALQSEKHCLLHSFQNHHGDSNAFLRLNFHHILQTERAMHFF